MTVNLNKTDAMVVLYTVMSHGPLGLNKMYVWFMLPTYPNFFNPTINIKQEQSDLGPHCLFMRLQIFSRRQKHTFCDYAL